jgi:hypothetical protein
MGNWCRGDRERYQEFVVRPFTELGILVAPSARDFRCNEFQFPCHTGEVIQILSHDDMPHHWTCDHCRSRLDLYTPSVLITTEFGVCGACYKRDRLRYLSTLAITHFLLVNILCPNMDVAELLRREISKLFISAFTPEKEYVIASEWRYDDYVRLNGKMDTVIVDLTYTEEVEIMCDSLGLVAETLEGDEDFECRIICSGSHVQYLLRANRNYRVRVRSVNGDALFEFYEAY